MRFCWGMGRRGKNFSALGREAFLSEKAGTSLTILNYWRAPDLAFIGSASRRAAAKSWKLRFVSFAYGVK